MSQFLLEGLIEGVFISEIKNRFLCTVLVNDIETICYVPCSCRLSNFLDLKDKKVLLLPVSSKKARTSYSVLAIEFKRNYILLNTSIPNRVLENEIKGRRFSFLGKRREITHEVMIDDYKCDLYIHDTDTIVEIKSIISAKKTVQFPTVYSERANRQLESILRLLENGHRVVYLFASLNPYVINMQIAESEPYSRLFKICIKQGMIVKGASLRLQNNEISVSSLYDIEITE